MLNIKNNRNSLLSGVVFVATASYFLDYFFQFQYLYLFYGTLAFILLVSSLRTVTLGTKVVSLFLIVIGFVIFYLNGLPITKMMSAFGYNLNLLALFVYIPFIAVYLSSAHYLDALRYKVQQLEKKGIEHPYRYTALLTLTISSVLNLGSMPVIYRLAEHSFSGFSKKRLGLIIVRSFGACMLWSPYFVNIGLVLVLFHLSWGSMALILMLFSILYVLLIAVFFKQTKFSDDEIVEAKQEEESVEELSLKPLIAFAIVLLSLSFLLDSILEANMLTIVSLLALFFPVVWSIFARNTRFFIQDSIPVVTSVFQRMKNEIAIFVSAGFFAGALSLTDVGVTVSTVIDNLSGGHIYIMSTLVIIFAMILSLIGVHPVVIIIGIGSSLTPEIFGVSNEYMAMLLIIAWMLSTQMSPFSGSLMMISSMMKVSPWTITQKNIPFVLTAFILFSMILYGLYYFQLL